MSIKSHLAAFWGTKIRKKSEIKTKLRVFFIFTLYKGNKKPQKGQFSPLFAVFAVVPQSAVFYKTSGGRYVYLYYGPPLYKGGLYRGYTPP